MLYKNDNNICKDSFSYIVCGNVNDGILSKCDVKDLYLVLDVLISAFSQIPVALKKCFLTAILETLNVVFTDNKNELLLYKIYWIIPKELTKEKCKSDEDLLSNLLRECEKLIHKNTQEMNTQNIINSTVNRKKSNNEYN